ncbi:MAG: hypothetical protein JXR78_13190 [Victivallales bacterium]|nr:hypothetical protein [Victivallales bacterium]
MVSKFTEKQSVFSVNPFVEVIKERGIKDKDIFLTLALSISTIQDEGFRELILNWVTSYPEISGIYLMINFNEVSKQICDYNKLICYFSFIKELRGADLKIICGYTGLEELMLCCMDIDIITMGAFENIRKFDIDKFLDNEGTKRGPAPRIYFPKLMNSIRFVTANTIREDKPELWEKIYTPTKYSEKIFDDYVNQRIVPHFTKKEQYMHYFILVSEQIKSLLSLPVPDRINDLKQKIKDANNYYHELDANEILWFDRNCTGDHLPTWFRATKWIQDNY